MSTATTPSSYAEKTARLTSNWQSGSGPLRLEEVDDLEPVPLSAARHRRAALVARRVQPRARARRRSAATVEVEGLTTYETVVRYCLRARLPAARGARVQAHHRRRRDRRHRHRVHLLPLRLRARRTASRRTCCCRAARSSRRAPTTSTPICSRRCRTRTARSATFCAPRSRCIRASAVRAPARGEVHGRRRRTSTRCASPRESPDLHFVEGLFFEDGRYFLMTGRFAEHAPAVDDIVRKDIFYRLVETRRDIYLKTFDYIFRYDPDWFWNVPETGFFNLFRRYAPEHWRNSAFYTKYVALKRKALGSIGIRDERMEPLIQDWEVPWEHGEELIRFAIDNVDSRGAALGGRADQGTAPADALPDQAKRALLQPRLLLPSAAPGRHGAVPLHEDPRPQVLRARRHQDAVLVVVPERERSSTRSTTAPSTASSKPSTTPAATRRRCTRRSRSRRGRTVGVSVSACRHRASRCELRPRLDDDLGFHGVRDKAALVGVVVELGEIVG